MQRVWVDFNQLGVMRGNESGAPRCEHVEAGDYLAFLVMGVVF